MSEVGYTYPYSRFLGGFHKLIYTLRQVPTLSAVILRLKKLLAGSA